MKPITLAIEVMHEDFWYGVYGWTPPTSWEDLYLYEEQNGALERVGYACLCSRAYLRDSQADFDPEDASHRPYLDKVQAFLQREEVTMHYYYPSAEEEDPRTLDHANLPTNEQGRRPRSIEMWLPVEGIDLEALNTATHVFCETFLQRSPSDIQMLGALPPEDLLVSYLEYKEVLNSDMHIEVSPEQLSGIADTIGRSPEWLAEFLAKQSAARKS